MDGFGGDDDNKRCFICWRRGGELEAPEIGGGLGRRRRKIGGDGGDELKRELGVMFLVRKVLGLKKEVLEGILEEMGGLGGWGVEFCGGCGAVFREAMWISERLMRLQRDWEEVVGELRGVLVESWKGGDEGIGRRKGRGRPKSKKKEEEDGHGKEESAVERLRRTFVIGWNKKEGLELNEAPKTLFVQKETGSVLDGVCTSQPIQVKIGPELLKGQGEMGIQKTPVIIKRVVTVTTLDEDEETEATAVSAAVDSVPVVKREVVVPDPEEPLEDLEPGFLNGLPVGQDDHENDDDWVPDDNEDDPEDDDKVPEETTIKRKVKSKRKEAEDDDDSDYVPENPQKKDKRFTRIKPNHKENQRKKYQRTLKAQSFTKVKLGTRIIPVKKENSEVYTCPESPCKEEFSRKYACRVHVLQTHFEDPLPHHCHICDNKRFQKEMSFRKHMVRFHNGVRCPYDDDYDPNLHSAEKLRSAVAEDEAVKNLMITGGRDDLDNQSENEEEPGVPEEVLKLFRNSKTATFTCRHSPCKRIFKSEMLRDGHEKRIHFGIEACFDCFKCPKKFIRRGRLLEHLAISHYSNHPSCHHCGARFVDKVLLAGHIGRAHLGDKTPFHCTSCPAKFCKRTKMDLHMFQKHGTPLPTNPFKRKIPARNIPVPKIEPVKAKKLPEGETLEPIIRKCWVCYNKETGQPLVFPTPEDIKAHITQLHQNSEKPFKCPVPNCFKEYKINGNLDYHVCNVHGANILNPTMSEVYQCSHCPLKFHRSYLLDKHMIQHGISLYMCNFCAKQFRTKKYLEDHQRQAHYKELGINPWKCKYCGKIMNTAKSLDHHVKTVHTKDTPVKCSVQGCNFGTMYHSSMKTHMNIKHSNRKNAICPVCSRMFACQFYLNRHMRVHTGEKPYKCGTCQKQFSDLPTYQRHCEAHLGRVHKCVVEGCGKEYNTRHAWRVHLKQHQSKGVNVEIPKVRYQPEEMDLEVPKTNEEEEGMEEIPPPILEQEENRNGDLAMEEPPILKDQTIDQEQQNDLFF